MSLLRGLVFSVVLLTANMGQAQTIHQKIVKFLESKRGVRIGGGECAHAASEALRVAGGEFLSAELGEDSPSSGDYVWGTLVKVVSCADDEWKDSDPSAKTLPGDILQYGDSKLLMGNSTWTTTHHTSIVATVNSEHMPISVYQQNVNGHRTLEKDPTDLTKLVAGWIKIYRPTARIDKPGKYKFTVVNNTVTEQVLSLKFGTQSLKPITLASADTGSSYSMESLTTSSPTARFRLELSTGNSIPVDNAVGYELYAGADEKVAIRKLLP